MLNALDSEMGFCVASRFRFEELFHVARPASPLRYVGDILLGIVGAFIVIEKQALAFFAYLLEMNSARVQSDVVERVQDSRGRLEAEIRKLLDEVTRIATSALEPASEARAAGVAAVEAKLAAIREADDEIGILLSAEIGGDSARSA